MILTFPRVNVNEVNDEEIFASDGLFNVRSYEAPENDDREIFSLKESGIESLFEQSVDLSNKCVDYTLRSATTENIFFKDNGRFSFRPDVLEDFISNCEISDFALGQFCAKLGVPKGYIDKCLRENPLLATENINSWLETYDKGLFLRLHEDKIRGVLSPKYSVFDTPEILNGLMSTYDFSDFTVKGSFISPERFSARLVMPRNLDIPMEDDLLPGIQIDSSDVGRSTLKVRFMIFKQVCTNGLVISQGGGVLFQQKHIGISREEFINGFNEAISTLPTLIENSEAFINHAKNVGVQLDTPEQMLEFASRLQKSAQLPEESAKRVLNIVKSEIYGSPSKWTLINALTQEAQNFTLEKRLEIEKYAGNLLVA